MQELRGFSADFPIFVRKGTYAVLYRTLDRRHCSIRAKFLALLREEKTLIGLANSFGGLLVWLAYVLVQP